MKEKSKRGFASMDRARQREIAAKGGRAAHAKGTAHVWSADEARAAGKRGGEVVSQDRDHMSTIGKEGGAARREALRKLRRQRTAEQTAAHRPSSIAPGDRTGQMPMGFSVQEGRELQLRHPTDGAR